MIELVSMVASLAGYLVMVIALVRYIIFVVELELVENHIGLKLLDYVLIIIGSVDMAWLFTVAFKDLSSHLV